MNPRWIPFSRMRAACAVIESSALPPDVQAFVTGIVRRTKLRAAERADVARELCSHFYEAIAAGRSPADAIAAYGDPRASARQLRTAAVAKRHVLDRAVGTAFTWTGRACGVLLLAYACFWTYLALQPPKITFDPIERIRALLPKPASDADLAWPSIRDAMLAMGFRYRESPESGDPTLDAVERANEWLPGQPEWTASVEALRAKSTHIAALRAACMRPVLGFPLGGTTDEADIRLLGPSIAATRDDQADNLDPENLRAFGLLLPHLARVRTAARVLAADSIEATEAGDGARACDDLRAMIRLSVTVQDGRILINDLVGIAIRSMAESRIRMVLEWRPSVLTDAQLLALQREIEAIPPDRQRMDTRAELVCADDLLQRLYTDDGNGDGWFRPTWSQLNGFESMGMIGTRASNRVPAAMTRIGMPVAAFAVAGRRATRDLYAQLATDAERMSALPLQRQHTEPRMAPDMNAMLGDTRLRVRWLLPALLTPAFDKAARSYATDRAVCDATRAALAAERFRRTEGRWPRDLGELVPRFMASVPQDPWADAPLRVAAGADGFRIYSVWMDGIDDDGALPDASDWRRGRQSLGGLNAPPSPDGTVQRGDCLLFHPTGSLDPWRTDPAQ